MSKADQVREYLKENPTGNCKEAYAAFIEKSKLTMHYSQFNTIFRKYCAKNDIELVKATKETKPEDLPYEEKVLHDSSFPMKCWKDLSDEEKVKATSIGAKVMIAGDQLLYEVKSFHNAGDPMWPVAAGVTIVNDKFGRRDVYLDCVKIAS